jgi:hypothetical protein
MKNNNTSFKYFLFPVPLIIVGIISFALSCIIYNLILTIDSLYETDYSQVLPLKVSSHSFIVELLQPIFRFGTEHYNLYLFLNAFIIFAGFLGLIFVFRKLKPPVSLLSSAYLLVLFAITILLAQLFLPLLQKVLLLYSYDLYNIKLFGFVFLLLFLPGLCLIGAAYILFTVEKRYLRYALSAMFAGGLLLVFFLSFHFYEKKLFKGQMTSIDGYIEFFHFDKTHQPLTLAFLTPDSQITTVQMLNLQHLNAKTFESLSNKINMDSNHLLLEDYNDFALKYYVYTLNFEGYYKFLLTNYEHNKNLYNAMALYKAIKNISPPGFIPEELEHVYKSKQTKVSKISYGFLSVLFLKSGNHEKASQYWKKYNETQSRVFKSQKVMPWLEDIQQGKIKQSTFTGNIMKNASPLAGETVLLLDRKKAIKMIELYNADKIIDVDIFMSALYDYTKTDQNGHFKLNVWSCKPLVMVLHITGKDLRLEDTELNELLNKDCGSLYDLKTINIMDLKE